MEGAKEPPSSKNTFVSSAVPLSHRVSDKVKIGIWGNECVDFAVIFSNSSTSDDQYTFKVLNGRGEQPTLSLEQMLKNSQFTPLTTGRLLFKHLWWCIVSVSLRKQPN